MIVEYSLTVNVVDFLTVCSLDQQCSVLSHFSRVRFFATQCTGAHQAPLSMGTLQARVLEWAAMPSSRGPSQPWDWTLASYISCTDRQVLYHEQHLGS